MIVFAESSGANPYAAQNAAVSARAGSQGKSSYSPRPASAASRAARSGSGSVMGQLRHGETVPPGRPAAGRRRETARLPGERGPFGSVQRGRRSVEALVLTGEDQLEPGEIVGLVDPVHAITAGAVRRDPVRVHAHLHVGVVHEEGSARVAGAGAAAMRLAIVVREHDRRVVVNPVDTLGVDDHLLALHPGVTAELEVRPRVLEPVADRLEQG